MILIPTIAYVMKAKINSPPYQKVTWRVYDVPDLTGAHSGYPLGGLIDILIDYTIDINQATENGATPVYIAPTGPAGGDLGGAYPNPLVVGLQGRSVSSIGPSFQQVLTWNGTSWGPATPLGGPPSGAAGGDLSGFYPNPTVSNISHITAGGDLSGSYPNPTVFRIGGALNGTTVPTSGPAGHYYVLTGNGSGGSYWDFIDDNNVRVAAGIQYSKLNLTNGIVNSDVNSAAAIAGTKIQPNFGSQQIVGGALAINPSNATTTITGSFQFGSERTFSSNTTIDSGGTNDAIILADTSGGSFTITLPPPSGGRILIIKDKTQSFATHSLTIARHGSEKIDGVAASMVLSVQNQEVIFTSDGADWYTNNSANAGAAGGDLSGTYPNPTVAKVDGVSYPASPSTNTVPVVTSSNTVTYQQIANAQVSATAAIAGSKINPLFGSQTLGAGQFNLGSTTLANSLFGSIVFTTKVFSSTGTIDTATNDFIVYADTSGGAFTLTLPTPTTGRMIFIKDYKQSFASNNLTLARHSTEKIDGVAASLVLSANNEEIILTSDGTDWFTQGGAIGAAGGDLSGTYPNPTVVALQGHAVSSTAPTSGQFLEWNGSAWTPATASGVTWANDLATSTNTSQNVVGLTGSSGTVAVHMNNLTWDAGVAGPTIQQTTTAGAAAGMSILAQTSSAATGGSLTLDAGSAGGTSTGGAISLGAGASGNGNSGGSITINGGTSSAAGSITLNSGSNILTLDTTNGIKWSPFGTGIVHSGSTGILSSSLIVNADVSGSAAIAYSKLNLNNSIVNSDIFANAAIDYSKLNLTLHIVDSDISGAANISISKFAPGTAGQIMITNGGPAASWQTMTGDVSITSSAATTVLAISGSSPLVIIPSEFQWKNSTSTPLLDQAALASTSSASGSNGQTFTVQSQAGQAATGAAHNGGNGGQLSLSSGAGGTSGSATAGSSGNISLQIAGTELIKLDGSTLGNVTFTNATAVPNFTQSAAANTNTPAAGSNWTVKSQTGTSAASGNNNGGNGGNLNLSAGAGGTHTGSGTDGTAGTVNVQTGGTTRLSISPTNVTIPAFSSAGVVLNDASGNLSSGQIVNSNVSSSAAIAVSKLANGTADQLLDTNHAATTTEWFTPGGDVSFASHNFTVTGIQGDAVPAPSGTNTFLKWSGSAFSWGSAGGVTWANDLAGSTSNNQYVASISGNNNAGGTIPINATTLQFYSIINPNINQGAYNPTSGNSGATGQTLTLTAQAGQNVTGASNNGGIGGVLALTAGAGGTSGSATGGVGGDVQVISGGGAGGSASGGISLQLGGTELIKISGATIGNVTFTNTTSVPSFTQTSQSSTSSGSGAAGSNFSITAQTGQAATGASHNGGNGGNLVLTAGAGGTSGSATAGNSGTVNIASAVVFNTVTKTANYTLTYTDHHIFCNNTSGITLTLPAPVNGLTFEVWDIKGTAETNNITLAQNASEKISGVAASRVLQTNWGHWTVTSNGTDWFVG